MYTNDDRNFTNDQQETEKLLQTISALSRSERGPKALTQSTVACLEDALAVATDIIISGYQQQKFTTGRLRTLAKILQTGREGPYAYPIDQAAGCRPEKGDL